MITDIFELKDVRVAMERDENTVDFLLVTELLEQGVKIDSNEPLYVIYDLLEGNEPQGGFSGDLENLDTTWGEWCQQGGMTGTSD